MKHVFDQLGNLLLTYDSLDYDETIAVELELICSGYDITTMNEISVEQG